MKVTKEISSFDELKNQSWEGAIDTLNVIQNNNMEDDLMNFLEMVFKKGIDESTLNNYLWFERNEIYTTLGIEE